MQTVTHARERLLVATVVADFVKLLLLREEAPAQDSGSTRMRRASDISAYPSRLTWLSSRRAMQRPAMIKKVLPVAVSPRQRVSACISLA
jgi:hypothetical protein